MRTATDTLDSARLTVRRFTSDDLDLVARLLADPVVTQHLGGPKDRAGAEQTLRTRALDYYDRHPGLGMWATIERASGRVVGFHVLNHIHGEPDIQVGYALFQDAWGLGYATEMSVRLLRYGFEELGLPVICAITNLDNAASQRVLLKAGLTRKGERTFVHPALAGEGSMAWFEAHRTTWHL
ncbi:MAG: GNAT family N-acetyltransferase [Acidobacteria bacterium]|nr:GNAT family N-acetyltransferase [Acidobacteriota bacterium]